jgi:predicted SprT family Zn-dependent metalloprotease
MDMIQKFRELIRKYVPEESVDYCVDKWDENPFSFKVTRQRTSKIGDYRYNKKTRNHEITVNGNLNPYAFLITYLHEVAHLKQYLDHGNNRPPHGLEWKKIFQDIMEPMLNNTIFPDKILVQLKIHMKNPKASSQSDAKLSKLLRKYNSQKYLKDIYLEDLSEGEVFDLNGRLYTKIKKRRTRSLCKDNLTGKKYLVSELTPVKKIELG